jgi:hypothetical protein
MALWSQEAQRDWQPVLTGNGERPELSLHTGRDALCRARVGITPANRKRART